MIQTIGISAPEVKLAAALFTNKKLPEEFRDCDDYFICEGLWAAEKLAQKNIPIEMLFECDEMLARSTAKLALGASQCGEHSTGASGGQPSSGASQCGERSASASGEQPTSAKLTDRDQARLEIARRNAKKIFKISEKACAKISDRDGAEGAFIVARMPKLKLSDIRLTENMTAVILDGQEQPGNIGAILRSLDAAGGDFAIYTNRRVKLTHSRLIRASLGAAFMLPFVEAGFEETIEFLEKNGFKAIVTDLTAKKSYIDADYQGRIAIVCGNEYQGISPAWREQAFAEPVIIPMLGSVESLNVGFATTLVAYECSLRQKGLK